MSTRRARGESPRRHGPTLTTSWGYRGGGQQSLVLGQMFVVRNVTMLRLLAIKEVRYMKEKKLDLSS